jgi:hypothetical protein
MRGKILLLPILGLAAIQLSSCQRKSFDPTLAGAFFPLRPGLSWTYRIIDERRSTAQIFSEGRGTTHIFSDRVIGQRRVATGERADEVESEYSEPSGTLHSSILYFPEGGYLTRQFRINETARAMLAERAFLPEQLKPDLTWSNSLVVFDAEPDIFHIFQTHRTFFDTTTVEVPAGHFSGCIRIETAALYKHNSSQNYQLRLKYLDWYAPHIGLVKTLVEQSGLFGAELARIELLNFGYSPPGSATPLTSPSLRGFPSSRSGGLR